MARTTRGIYLLYTLGEFTAGMMADAQNVTGGIGTILGNLATGGEYSGSYPMLDAYFAHHPEWSRALIAASQLELADISRDSGVPQEIVEAYIARNANSSLRAAVNEYFGKGLDEDYKKYGGGVANFLGHEYLYFLIALALAQGGPMEAPAENTKMDDFHNSGGGYSDYALEAWTS